MGKLRFYTALILSHIIYFTIKILSKSSGTSFVGMSAMKICPNFLKYCRDYVKNGNAVTITGTNGKTTTSGFLAHILKVGQNTVLHNAKGANMIQGIANTFALNINPLNKFDYAVIETDEAYLTKLYDYFLADSLIVTNLYRDQLDRYGELATTAGFIQNAIDKNPNLTLVLNADDPLVSNYGKSNVSNVKYFGFEEVEYFAQNQNTASCAPTEIYNCICHNPLIYTKQFFAQEGHYSCEHCGYKRPEPDYKGYAKIYNNYTELRIENEGKSYDFRVNLIGLYNAYNALAAISQALIFGIDYEKIKLAAESYKPVFGRAEHRVINGHNTLIQLIKNPTGASEVLKTVDLTSNIVIALNDDYADGRDMSWLWDTDFELLKNVQNPIITTGIRAKDMAVRLKYAGITSDRIIIQQDLRKAVELAASSNNPEQNVTILPSYTALLKITKMKF